ncbi:hypothetical protein K523DRAFT_6018 [Schizophyllum commune Tattone D]|nr:hypothetical protein K523DRAFT_6018 [Schizophyllum commune Tattone D]
MISLNPVPSMLKRSVQGRLPTKRGYLQDDSRTASSMWWLCSGAFAPDCALGYGASALGAGAWWLSLRKLGNNTFLQLSQLRLALHTRSTVCPLLSHAFPRQLVCLLPNSVYPSLRSPIASLFSLASSSSLSSCPSRRHFAISHPLALLPTISRPESHARVCR